MYKPYLELAAGLLALLAGLFALKNGVTIGWLFNGVLRVAGVCATRSETIAWLCVGLASIFLSRALRGWMKVKGYPKWNRMAWPVVLVFALLLSCWPLIQWLSPPKPDTLQFDKNRGKMLAGARLREAKLNSANLRMGMLAGADLRGSDLESADLHGAMLLGANLSNANLGNANFEEANLLGAYMDGAQIDGANFKNAAFLTQDQINEACGKPRILPEGLRAPKPC
jgi:hypothetical protein